MSSGVIFMPTGACGVNCDTCRLQLLGMCSSCGSGKSDEGRDKATAQMKLFGAACPVLACAIEKRVAYCMRDCEGFPCDKFRSGPYPFSEAFLSMQERRRKEGAQHRSPSGDQIKVSPRYWDDLAVKNPAVLCSDAEVTLHPQSGILMPFLNEWLLVNVNAKSIYRECRGAWQRIEDPLMTLICLVYLLGANPRGLINRPVSATQLKCAHFFRGPHELNLGPLERRFGEDLDGFKKAAEALGGTSLPMADAAYMLKVFPKVPVYVLLWEQDEEFEARVSILFDQSVEAHLAADAIWGLVSLITRRLLTSVSIGCETSH